MEAVLGLFKLAAGCATSGGFLPSLYDSGPGLTCDNGQLQLTSLSGVLVIVGNAVRILIAASGAVAVITIIVASIFFITSAGDPGRIKRARDIIQYTATGLVLILISYAVITFIAQGF
jgi:hypothetical protein